MKSALRTVVSVMGTWMGLAGLEHGIGEIMQGNVAPAGVMIQSWPDAPFFHGLGGEPAMTVLPDLRLTGILAITFSLLFCVWAAFCVQRRYGGLVMMLLAGPMLLFGGGIFPPVMGFVIGAVATRLQVAPRPAQPAGWKKWLGKAWPWIFGACCAAWLALFPGVAVLGTFVGIDQAGVVLAFMAVAFSLLPLAFISARQHDVFESAAL